MAQSAGEAAGRARQTCASQGAEGPEGTPRQGPATCSVHTWPRPPDSASPLVNQGWTALLRHGRVRARGRPNGVPPLLYLADRVSENQGLQSQLARWHRVHR
jgi:hypothetical protein